MIVTQWWYLCSRVHAWFVLVRGVWVLTSTFTPVCDCFLQRSARWQNRQTQVQPVSGLENSVVLGLRPWPSVSRFWVIIPVTKRVSIRLIRTFTIMMDYILTVVIGTFNKIDMTLCQGQWPRITGGWGGTGWNQYVLLMKKSVYITVDLETIEPQIIASYTIIRWLRTTMLHTRVRNYQCDLSQSNFPPLVLDF